MPVRRAGLSRRTARREIGAPSITLHPPPPMIVRFLRLESNPDLPLPARQTPGSAGYDVASAEPDFVLQPGERRLVATGLAMELPDDVECQVRPRSGLALRHGITLPNSPATIDPDYRGELKVIVWNAGGDAVPIPRGTRIAQLVFARFVAPAVEETDALSSSGRGEAGFGSTG
jgi:dUTP pyrophosphatase